MKYEPMFLFLRKESKSNGSKYLGYFFTDDEQFTLFYRFKSIHSELKIINKFFLYCGWKLCILNVEKIRFFKFRKRLGKTKYNFNIDLITNFLK